MTLCVAMPGHGSLPAWVSPRKTEVQLVHPSRRRAEAERLWPQPGIQRMDELKTGTRRVGVAVRRCRLVGRQGRLWLVVLQDWSKPCRWLRRLSPSSQKVLMSSKLAKLLDLKTNPASLGQTGRTKEAHLEELEEAIEGAPAASVPSSSSGPEPSPPMPRTKVETDGLLLERQATPWYCVGERPRSCVGVKWLVTPVVP